MNILMFASNVDNIIRIEHSRVRSSFSKTQKDIMDKMIEDHFTANSTPREAADVIWSVLKSLD